MFDFSRFLIAGMVSVSLKVEHSTFCEIYHQVFNDTGTQYTASLFKSLSKITRLEKIIYFEFLYKDVPFQIHTYIG